MSSSLPSSGPCPSRPGVRRRIILLLTACLACLGFHAKAEIQFDVFIGYDDYVREGNWFPVAFEILNDGPTFNGSVALTPELGFDTQRREFTIELPTGTRKRVVIPVFSSAGRVGRWEARLFSESGKMLAERTALAPRDVRPSAPLLGALPRSFGGLPTLPEAKGPMPETASVVARLQADYLPENPIALEGLTAWYLNSEKAADLKPGQVDALLAWLHGGGHLIVGIEQAGDVNALTWLRDLLPFKPESVANVSLNGSLQAWLVSGRRALQMPSLPRRPAGARRTVRGTAIPGTPQVEPADPFLSLETHREFDDAEAPVVLGRVADGEQLVSVGNTPLIVSAARGRGTVTVLTFSPEREPFRSWKNRSWFWAKLIPIPIELLTNAREPRWGGVSVDGLFGAMLDSRQIRKLPVAALLLLLVVYLGVIGPFDQWFLKRIGKQMWTWVTFPLYVVLFSGLIYFIGYRLRAGDLEWNELQVVDQLPRPEGATLRGRTWVSIYSPVNARYRLASESTFSTLRAELQASIRGDGESARVNIQYPAKGFVAEAFIPVWVSQLYANDWVQPSSALVSAQLARQGDTLRVDLKNHSSLEFSDLSIAYEGRMHQIGGLKAGGEIHREFTVTDGSTLSDILSELPMAYSSAQQRGSAFGGEGSGQFPRSLKGVILSSLGHNREAVSDDGGEGFVVPNGFEMSRLLARGEAVLFGWAPGQSIAAPIHRFSPRRLQRDTVIRLSLPVGVSAP